MTEMHPVEAVSTRFGVMAAKMLVEAAGDEGELGYCGGPRLPSGQRP